MEELPKLMAMMEAQETRLLGFAHCIVPKEEIIVEPSVFIPQQLQIATKNILQTPPDLVQIIEPLESIDYDLSNRQQASKTDSVSANAAITNNLPPNESEQSVLMDETINLTTAIAATTTTTTSSHISAPNPDENNVDILTNTEKMLLLPLPVLHLDLFNKDKHNSLINTMENASTAQSVSVLESTTVKNDEKTAADISSILSSSVTSTTPSQPIPLLLFKTETIISSTTPPIAEIILGELKSVSKSPEPDNYIYETFSPISPVDIGSITSIQQNDHIVIAEEPPENIPDAVPAA